MFLENYFPTIKIFEEMFLVTNYRPKIFNSKVSRNCSEGIFLNEHQDAPILYLRFSSGDLPLDVLY